MNRTRICPSYHFKVLAWVGGSRAESSLGFCITKFELPVRDFA